MTGNHAGQSAEEIARRQRAKIARLQRVADAWDAGAAGERATAQVLSQLDPAYWRVLHDVPWPGRPKANIDHVAIGPPGVFVIDSKNWSGSVTVGNNVLRQNGRRREQTVAGVADAGIAVLELVPDVPVHPVLCFVREERLEGWVRDVMLCSTTTLLRMMTTRPTVLEVPDQRRVTATLEAGLRRSSSRAPSPAPRSRTPASARASAAPRRRSRSRGPRVARRLVGLLLFLLLLGGVQTGLYFEAWSRLGDVLTGVAGDEDQPADVPQKQHRKDRPGKGKSRG